MSTALALEQSIAHDLQHIVEGAYNLHGLISRSLPMLDVFTSILTVAPTKAAVVIEGETGTGKELVARAIHEISSDGRDLPFVAVNCSAIPETLFESELFGYKKGAFTDAKQDRLGLSKLADGGTLFLDEVTTLNPANQAKILRLLQEGEFRPLGSPKIEHADFRLIAATNEGLRRAVLEGRFRKDLYYRINVFDIQLPSLPNRSGDISLLAAYFCKEFADRYKKSGGISAEGYMYLESLPWPGNVRQLRNLIESAVVVSREHQILDADYFSKIYKTYPQIFQSRGSQNINGVRLPVDFNTIADMVVMGDVDYRTAVEMYEIELLTALMPMFGNIFQTAHAIGRNPSTIHKFLKRVGVGRYARKSKKPEPLNSTIINPSYFVDLDKTVEMLLNNGGSEVNEESQAPNYHTNDGIGDKFSPPMIAYNSPFAREGLHNIQVYLAQERAKQLGIEKAVQTFGARREDFEQLLAAPHYLGTEAVLDSFYLRATWQLIQMHIFTHRYSANHGDIVNTARSLRISPKEVDNVLLTAATH